MIDFHSHILPCMDDGSKSVEESLGLLKMLSAQEVDTVCATPHFYADRETVDAFLCRRQDSYAKLLAALPENAPQIRLGAEVSYYESISALAGIERLCITGSDILLLEMPISTWSEYTVRELDRLACSGNVTVMLAHIERSLTLQKAGTMERLLENGILMQTNASFFLRRTTRRKAIHLLKNGAVHVLGSDCHNLLSRPPHIGEACSLIRKKLGTSYMQNIDDLGYTLLRTPMNAKIKHF